MLKYLPLQAPYKDIITNRFSIGDELKPMHVTIVKGFHKYTRAAISPDGRLPGKSVPFSNHYQNSINGRKCKRLGMYSKRKIKYMQTIKVYNKGGIGILYSYLRL